MPWSEHGFHEVEPMQSPFSWLVVCGISALVTYTILGGTGSSEASADGALVGSAPERPGGERVPPRCDPDPEAGTDEHGRPRRIIHRTTGIALVLVPAGTFRRGAEPTPARVGADEMPSHAVTLTRPFYLGETEVTQSQWMSIVREENPSRNSRGGDWPVEHVSYIDVLEFLSATGTRLPTEAEWEYAAKGGSGEPAWGRDDAHLIADRIGWHRRNSNGSTQPVRLKAANQFGVYDLFGNVREWTGTLYDGAEYARCAGGVADPPGPSRSNSRVIKGQDMGHDFFRASERRHEPDGHRSGKVGLRIAIDAQ